MAAEGEEARSPHVVLFPFLAHGHIPAFLRLAGHLQTLRPGLAVTLVSTPRLLGSLSLPATSPPIRLHALPFAPADHGLPDGAESLADLHVHQFITLFRASESLRPAFDGFVAGIRPPVCVIADSFFAWTADVARARGASHAVFLPGGAFGHAVFFSVWEHLPHTLTAGGDEFPLLPDFPDVVLHRTQIPQYMLAATGADPWTAFFRRVIPCCRKTDAVLVNTIQELETSGLDMLRASFGVQTWAIGPILAAPDPSKSQDDDDTSIIRWLDAHPRRSVLYISFGSQNSISIRQMAELALGLEASRRPFVWAVRPPVGFDPKDGFDPGWLPAGFEDRMARAGRGLVVRGWAPQARILAQPSTGAFLTHCGWNSILESLRHGVPLLGWPVGAEQFFNAMVVVEWVVCVEVARGNLESSAVESGEVAEAVGAVMGETEKGEAMRRKAGEIARAMAAAWEGPAGSSAASLERFLRCVEASALRDSCLGAS
uniref:Glycosyltransferase n=1 Tax=Oryza sativa TaxID=4530 RepID=Q01J09_ORYSA|nr:OSIGBa0145C12.3 [Oryza sativa]